MSRKSKVYIGTNFHFLVHRLSGVPDSEHGVVIQGITNVANRNRLCGMDRYRRRGHCIDGNFFLSRTNRYLAALFHRNINSFNNRIETCQLPLRISFLLVLISDRSLLKNVALSFSPTLLIMVDFCIRF